MTEQERAAKLIGELAGARMSLSRDGHGRLLSESDEALIVEALRVLAGPEAQRKAGSTTLPVTERVRHVKRGSTYAVLGQVTAQVSSADERCLRDYDELIVYRADEDGRLWARFPDEMKDGRFEPIALEGSD